MSNLLLYSPIDVEIVIAGLHTITGVADGTFVSITKDVEPFETERAMDGSIQRIYKHDEGFKLEITLAQSSPSNNILSALYNMDRITTLKSKSASGVIYPIAPEYRPRRLRSYCSISSITRFFGAPVIEPIGKQALISSATGKAGSGIPEIVEIIWCTCGKL